MKRAAAPVLHVAEPAPAYAWRPPMVVDCSVLSAALFQEETRDDALQLLTGKALHAPTLLDYEIVSVAVKKTRAGWPEAVISRALADYFEQALDLHHPDGQAQYALAARYQLSAYDAAYLWLAGELRAPLATFDAKLAAAARTHLAALD
ncbi:type II toxin-antitoxin system VapC family toxin [Ramlibacter sp.]|uniref:type II toxin-antitoxin system VapC family toxin n=1 Tax=Ramlibacter sp. TaxID=1917967 RepID=UPI0017F47E9D|nr:type II toxin-antitoxin system VapC family toxin [Ramlibacter sp.]MBA2676357.1 type II toxin-antitoxin system VapC family toxin [Ramlibacter sp.]